MTVSYMSARLRQTRGNQNESRFTHTGLMKYVDAKFQKKQSLNANVYRLFFRVAQKCDSELSGAWRRRSASDFLTKRAK
jgi:hypothetical protein